MPATMTRQQIEFRNHLVEAHQADLAGLDQAGLERLHRSLHEQNADRDRQRLPPERPMSAQQVLDLFDTGRIEETQPQVRSFRSHGTTRLVRFAPPASGQRHRACDDRCIHAVSDICSCRCGGANHGIGAVAYLTADEAAALLEQYR